jgi:signal transduction histidine kinase
MDADTGTPRTSVSVPGTTRVGYGRRPTRADLALTFGTLALMLTAVTLRQGHEEFPGPALLFFSVIAWLPLLVRTRWPLPVLVATVVAESLHLALVPFVAPGLATPIALAAYQPVPVATMVAAFTVATQMPRRMAWIAGGSAAMVLMVVSLVTRPLTLLATDVVMLLNLVVIATAVGRIIAGRRELIAREALEREEHARREVEGERLRIARELHDVLAHHLTLVNAQAAVADYLLRTDPQAAAEALRGLTKHTRSALDELRATVGLLRQEGDPTGGATDGTDGLSPVPGLERLDELLDGFRTVGSDVRLTVTGKPTDLPPRGDLAAYRIIQEALTNATKHAPGAPAHVTLDWSGGQLQLRVANDPAIGVPSGHRGPGTGHGLIGMRERALAAGGSLHIERPSGGGFIVSATIPAETIPAETGSQIPDDTPSTGRADP